MDTVASCFSELRRRRRWRQGLFRYQEPWKHLSFQKLKSIKFNNSQQLFTISFGIFFPHKYLDSVFDHMIDFGVSLISMWLNQFEILIDVNKTKSKKKMVEHTCGAKSKRAIASGYEIKAKPGPPITTDPISSVPNSCAKWPKIPNIVKPANIEVKVSNDATIVASR